jgi:FixJ family two-component response regulator
MEPVYTPSMRRHRVAVIDDDESVRTALVRLFRSVDFDAFAFSSARAFLSEFRDLGFDCLVLDLQMPEMTGLDLQRYLRMVYPDLSLPVVMITAHDEPGSCERCLAAGVAAYMHKPVEGTALVDEIRKLVCARH